MREQLGSRIVNAIKRSHMLALFGFIVSALTNHAIAY